MTNTSINLQDNTGTTALTYGIVFMINIKIVSFWIFFTLKAVKYNSTKNLTNGNLVILK
jgi:hypothetical protein